MTETREIIPLEDVELDIEKIADQLFLGPQAELLERIQNFNSRYGRHTSNGDIIQINKNYGFKPKTYDKIKEAFGNHCLGYSSQASSVWRLQERIDRYRWRQREFWRSAMAIQNSMNQLKSSNAGWQDNIEIVEQFWNDLKERIPRNIQDTLKIFTEDNVSVGINTDCINNSQWNNLQIEIELFTSNINMQVIYQDEEIANYEWGNVSTKWYVPFWKFMNNWCEGGPRALISSTFSNPSAKIYPKYPKLAHPYVSKNSYHNSNSWITYTCTGDLQHDLREAAWGLNIEALCTLTRSWLSRYHIPRTNPLNRITHCYYGWEIGMDEKIWKHRDSNPESEMSTCKWPDVFVQSTDYDGDNPCDICQFKEGFAYLIDDPNVPENSEYPGQIVREVKPCIRAITEYEIPETDDEIIKEACIMHIMCCSTLRNMPDISDYDIDYELSDENRFPANATLETIYEIHPNFNFDSAFRSEAVNWRIQNAEDLLDVVFNTRIWHDLIDEYVELFDLRDEDASDVEYDLRNESLEAIRRMISEEHQRINNQLDCLENPLRGIILEEETPFDPLTPEESAIRWATQNGRTLNI